MGNSDVAHRILVYTVIDTELNALNCVECLIDFDKVIVKMKLIKKLAEKYQYMFDDEWMEKLVN